MDVSQRPLSERAWPYALAAIVLLGLILRLRGIHNPILDHPGWRQGDTAAIARNFATLNFNPFFPQTDYNGPRDNFVELELQIVPYLAAIGYKVFGVHEVFGRLISIAFSLGTVAVAGYFARWLFGSLVAGYVAAFFFATYPGTMYYGRTFTPDTTMTFFLTAALFVTTRYLTEQDERSWRGFAAAALLTMTAILAKPVAAIALVPIAAASVASFGWVGTVRRPQTYAFLALALVPYVAYDRYLQSHAEWLWASGITSKHVVPALLASFGSVHAFLHKLRLFRDALGMLATTMLGPAGFALAIVGFIVPLRSRANAMLWGWLVAVALYAFAVVTVERVDYYSIPPCRSPRSRPPGWPPASRRTRRCSGRSPTAHPGTWPPACSSCSPRGSSGSTAGKWRRTTTTTKACIARRSPSMRGCRRMRSS